MAQFWTDYPKMDWWKLDPARWLLSRKFKSMPYQARGPFCCICFEMMREKLPGVSAFCEEQFADWGMLKPDEWELEKLHILKGFIVFSDKTMQHETIKEYYRSRCESEYMYYEKGKSGAHIKALKDKKAKKNSSPDILPYLDPYETWVNKPFLRADLFIKQGGLEGGLWGASTGGLQPPLGIREEEKREDKIFSSQVSSRQSTGGGTDAAPSPSSPLDFTQLKSITKTMPEVSV